ncbi:MAG TPA: hypothetical protein VGG99_14555 [Acetobacteraceae bacterium]|jgi:hypothetical protein
MTVSARIHHAEPPSSTATGQAARHYTGTSFKQVLSEAFDTNAMTGSARPLAHHAAARVRLPPPQSAAARSAPASASAALAQAMAAEHVPASWQPGLAFIMAHESAGKVGAQSPVHSARGLYQLTAANYHYNPHGAASFGNGVEEAQGGIRYIRARYGTAEKAVSFWHTHHWY